MTKYMLMYIQGPVSLLSEPLPGALFEVDKFPDLEKAQEAGLLFKIKHADKEVIIVPYFSVEI